MQKNMVHIDIKQDPREAWLTITGNRSATWSDNKRYLILQIGLSLFFCLPFAVLGYWFILLFAGFFHVALVICFWMVARSVQQVEYIRITEISISYSKSVKRSKTPLFRRQLPRKEVKFDLLKSSSRWYADKLIMRVPSGQTIIGETLPLLERHALFEHLCKYMGADIQQLEPSSTVISLPNIDDYSFFSK